MTELGGVRAGKLLSLNIKALTAYRENNPVKSELCTLFRSNEAASLYGSNVFKILAKLLAKVIFIQFSSLE